MIYCTFNQINALGISLAEFIMRCRVFGIGCMYSAILSKCEKKNRPISIRNAIMLMRQGRKDYVRCRNTEKSLGSRMPRIVMVRVRFWYLHERNPRWQGLYRDDSKNVFCLIREKGLIPRWLYEWNFHRERMKSTKKRFIRLMLDPASFVQRFIPRKRNVGLKGWGEAACDPDGLKRILDA